MVGLVAAYRMMMCHKMVAIAERHLAGRCASFLAVLVSLFDLYGFSAESEFIVLASSQDDAK